MQKYLIPPKGARRSYRGRYRVGDNPKVHEVTLHTTVKEVAEKRLKEIFEDAQREEDGLIPAADTRKAMKRPLMELFEEFLKEVRKRERSSEYLRSLKIRFPATLKFCHWKTLSDITAKSFLDWRNSNHGYAVRTQNHFLDSVTVFLNWAERTYEVSNPLKRIQKLPQPQKSMDGPRAFTEDELARLCAAAPRRQFYYRFMAMTGLRHEESRRLLWKDVQLDGENPGLYLRPEATKSRRADWLPILPALVPELCDARPVWAKPETPVFWRGVVKNDTLHLDMAKAGIARADSLGRSAGIHTFRRTFITQLQKAGVPSRVIMQLARHKSLKHTDWVYTDATQLPLKEGLQALAGIAAKPTDHIQNVPRPLPLKSGQNGVLESKPVQTEKSQVVIPDSQPIDNGQVYPLPSLSVQDCPKLKMVGVVGFEPTASTSRT